MSPDEWLSREFSVGRLATAPPDDALALAVELIQTVAGARLPTTTKTPGQGIPSVFVSAEVGRHATASTPAA
jgi:hypothetical protein